MNEQPDLFDQVYQKASEEERFQEGTCMDCKAEVTITPLAVAAAYTLTGILHRLQQPPLTRNQIVRCDECANIWLDKQQKISMAQMAEAKNIFVEMRKFAKGAPSDREIEVFTEELPGWFRSEHGAAIYGMKLAAEGARGKFE